MSDVNFFFFSEKYFSCSVFLRKNLVYKDVILGKREGGGSISLWKYILLYGSSWQNLVINIVNSFPCAESSRSLFCISPPLKPFKCVFRRFSRVIWPGLYPPTVALLLWIICALLRGKIFSSDLLEINIICQCFGSVSFWYGSGSSDPFRGITDPGPVPDHAPDPI